MSPETSNKIESSVTFWKFLPFWIFMTLYKFGGGLHYSLMSPLGARLLPIWIVGLLISAAAFIEMLFDVSAGRILDRYGYLKFLSVTTMVFSLAAICLFFGLNIFIYIISLSFSIFGWLFFNPGVNAYVLSHAPQENAGKFMSFRDVFGSIGTVLASIFLPFVIAYSPQDMGIIIFVILALSFVMLIFSPKEKRLAISEKDVPTEEPSRGKFVAETLKSIRRLNPASSLLLLLGLAAGTFYSIIWFVVPLIIAQQVNNGLLGVGLGIFDFSIVVLGYTLGNLADRANRRQLVFIGLLLFSVAGMFLGFNFGWPFLLFGFLATTGDEMASIALWSWLHSLEREEEHARDGTISGIISLVQDFGWAFGPLVAGFLYTFIGPSYTIALGAVPIFLLLAIYQLRIRPALEHRENVPVIPRKPHRHRSKN